MSRARGVAGLLGLALAATGLFAAIFRLHDAWSARGGRLVIGSKAFAESEILAEIVAQWIEQSTPWSVERRHHLGGTHVCFQALRAGALDLYPEYTGTGLVAILGQRSRSDPGGVLDVVRRLFATRYALVWTEPLGFENTYAIAVPGTLAARLSLRRVSDLLRHPELRAGFATEFLARGDGYPGLARAYGLRFDREPQGMEAGLMYRAAAEGHVDVISAYSTDGRIATQNLVVLDDDRRFFPPYEAVPLVRSATLGARPRLRALLRSLGGRITPEAMRAMNAEVDSGAHTARDIARAWLDRAHLPRP